MSYILDALRKADAQRERSRSPGLHDRPLGSDAGSPPGGRAPLLWGVLGVGMVSIGLAAWQLARPPGSTGMTAPVAQMSPSVPAPGTAPAPPPVAVAAAPGPATRIEPPPPAAVAPVAAPPAAPAVRPASVARAASAPGSMPASGALRSVAPAATAATAVPTPAAGAVAGAELSSTVPAGAPKLAISGGVYSQNPSQRMLIVNGQVFNEGSEPVAGVLLEQIRPNQAVLNWRGQRYGVAY